MVHIVADEIQRVFAVQSEYKWTAKSTTIAHRIDMLERLRAGILDYADRLQEALVADMGKPTGMPYIEEVTNALHPIDDAIAHLAEWAAPVSVEPSPGFVDVVEEIRYEARGVVLLFGPWNFPFQLLFEPLIPMIAAGNTVIMKPNEVTPETAKVSVALIREIFDEREVAIFDGGIDVSNLLLELPVDHIFFTGSPAVGKIIMGAAAKHLASVTLELGGKCPAIVDRTTDVVLAAETIGAARQSNGGQLCLSTDYVLVDESVKDEFVAAYLSWTRRTLYRDGKLDPLAMTHIVDERNMDRVLSYVDDARARGAKVLEGGFRSATVPDMIEPAVVLDAPLDSRIMTEEIFGPVLPVQSFRTADDVIRQVRRGTKPLAMYLFSDDLAFVEAVLEGTSSGGVTVNGWGSHWGETRLPFGGVNHSGIGRYHGIHGFKELSHERAVLRHLHFGTEVTDSAR